MKTAILLVAAGASRRLGQPKQLLPYRGSTLLEHSIDVCMASEIGNVFVVLGAHYELIFPKIGITKGTVLRHKNWANGMGSSIAFGMQKIQTIGDYSGVLISVADQPFLSSFLLQKIISKQRETHASIVTSIYEKGGGPPVYFAQQYFAQLADLEGDTGAKTIVKQHSKRVQKVIFLRGNIDVDTTEDLHFLEEK